MRAQKVIQDFSNSLGTRILAVAISLALILLMSNVAAFADGGNAGSVEGSGTGVPPAQEMSEGSEAPDQEPGLPGDDPLGSPVDPVNDTSTPLGTEEPAVLPGQSGTSPLAEDESPPAFLADDVEDVKVIVEAAAGVLPAGATLRVTVLQSDEVQRVAEAKAAGQNKKLVGYRAFDVVIYDAQGNEIQPNGTLGIRFENTGLDAAQTAVYHSPDAVAQVEKVADGVEARLGHLSPIILLQTGWDDSVAGTLTVTLTRYNYMPMTEASSSNGFYITVGAFQNDEGVWHLVLGAKVQPNYKPINGIDAYNEYGRVSYSGTIDEENWYDTLVINSASGVSTLYDEYYIGPKGMGYSFLPVPLSGPLPPGTFQIDGHTSAGGFDIRGAAFLSDPLQLRVFHVYDNLRPEADVEQSGLYPAGPREVYIVPKTMIFDHATLDGNPLTVVGGAATIDYNPMLGATVYFYYKPVDVYPITYHLNGGVNDPANPGEYTVATPDITLRDAVRTGYDFGGWFTDQGLTVPAGDPAIPTGSTGAKAFWAKWAAKTDVSYTVHYYLEGTAASVAPDAVRTGQTFGSTVTEDAKSVPGYTALPPTTQTMVLDAYGKEMAFFYRADAAYIVFEENGGTEVPDLSGVTGEAIADRTMPVTARAGHAFLGWYDNAALSGDPVSALPERFPAGTTTYWAKWSDVVAYPITYHLNGGVNNPANPGEYTVATPDITLRGAVRTGYDFGGWFTDQALTAPAGDPAIPTGSTGAKEFWAKWAAKTDVSYTVYYFLEGTTTRVAPDAVRTGQTFGSLVTEDAVGAPGYTALPPATQSMVLAVYGMKMTFFYTANEYDITHSFISATPGSTLPQEVLAYVPDRYRAHQGDVVHPTDFDPKTVPVPGGSWSFAGWDKESATVNAAGVVFTGSWAFAAAPVPPVPPVPPAPPTPTPVPVPPAAPVTPDAAPPAVTLITPPAVVEIDEGETPLAEGNAWCWVHFYMIIGMVLTAVYALVATVRRINFTKDLEDYERAAKGEPPVNGRRHGSGASEEKAWEGMNA